MIRFLFIFMCSLFFSVNVFAGNENKCVRLFAENLVEVINQNVDQEQDTIQITDDMLVQFFVNNINVCRDYLVARTSDEDVFVSTDGLEMVIEWEYLREEVAAGLTFKENSPERIMFVCENHRSLQAGIDAALWAATAVAAFFSFGSGGVAIAGAKEGVKQAAKVGTVNVVKIGVKKGVKQAFKEGAAKGVAKKLEIEIVDEAAVAAAKKAAQEATQAASRDVVIMQAKNALSKGGTKKVSDAAIRKEIEGAVGKKVGAKIGGKGFSSSQITKALELLDKKAAAATAKRSLLKVQKQSLATKALEKAMKTFAISTPLTALGAMGGVYSFLASGFDAKMMNCTNTDAGENCYTSCTKDSLSAPQDDLNKKAFYPNLSKNLCIDENSNYALREIKRGGIPSAGDILITTDEKWAAVKNTIQSNVADTGHCDWNEDDVDVYVATPLYDPSTLLPVNDGQTGLLIDGLRIDD